MHVVGLGQCHILAMRGEQIRKHCCSSTNNASFTSFTKQEMGLDIGYGYGSESCWEEK